MNATDFNVGDRVRLVSMDDPYRDVIEHIGTTGTVTGCCPPPVNTLNVNWDDSFSLNPCLDVDVAAKVG